MSATKEKRPLRVCSTCRHWTPKLKGFCDKLQQGAGKFHICEGWSDAAEDEEDLTVAKPQKAAGSDRA